MRAHTFQPTTRRAPRARPTPASPQRARRARCAHLRPLLAIAALSLTLALAACSDDDALPHSTGPTGTPPPTQPNGTSAGTTAPPGTSDRTPPTPPSLDPGPAAHTYTGTPLTLAIDASPDAVRFAWSPADGRPPVETEAPEVTLTWDAPGRYGVVVTAENAAGLRRSAQLQVVVVPPRVFTPASSSSVQSAPDSSLLVAVNEDADTITLVPVVDARPAAPVHVPTCRGPRRVAVGPDVIAVSCQHDDLVAILRPDRTEVPWGERAWGEVDRLSLPWGARPFGVLFDEAGDLWVAEQGRGALSRWRDVDGAVGFMQRVEGFDDARGLSRLPDGALLVTRWRSDAQEGVVWRYAPETGELAVWAYGYEWVTDTSVASSGVPSYLEQVAVSPDGELAAVAGLQANVLRGLHLSGEPLTFETTVRAILVRVDARTGEEVAIGRRQFDNRGFTSAAVFSAWGDWIWVAHRGSRSVERVDRFGGTGGGALINTGFAPSGLAVTPDGRLLVVENTLSRTLRVYDVAVRGMPEEVGLVPLVEREPLGGEVLRGAQLFADTLDPRLAKDGYIACAHCHLDGDADRFTWDFTDRGEGLRRTIPLLGRAGLAHGPLHWSANFDEVQDFEHDIRGPQGGRGLIPDAEFHGTGVDHPLGASKAGLSADLDALAAYVASLDAHPRSPWREAGGALTEAAERGRVIFESEEAGCTACHTGAHLTDSRWLADGSPLLHDVGTLREGSGGRLGEPLAGIDTPTLHGVWHSAPYLHDGSAATLREVLVDRNPEDLHGRTSHLTAEELADLEAWLRSL